MFLFFSVLFSVQALPADTLRHYEIDPVMITAPLKHHGSYARQPVAAISFHQAEIESGRIAEPKNLSLLVPNLLYADYGSKMTSSVYIRGIGARMDQPAIGLYVDNIPVLNKNNYDIDYFDVRSIDVLRGPQATLYGRNTIGGVIDVYTLSPFFYQGTRAGVEYGNGNSLTLNLSTYQKPTRDLAFSVAWNHRHSDGFFTNRYDGSKADRILSESGRVKLQMNLSEWLKMENIFAVNYVKQRGFAYAQYDGETGDAAGINHNDPCEYERFSLSGGVIFRYIRDGLLLSSTTGYQYTDDDMLMDQDFRPVSMFTLRQQQYENAFTQEFIARSTHTRRWQWISGISGFYRHIRMEAPVLFKKEGIEQLILANANAGLHTVFPDAELLIREEEFPIESRFKLPASGISFYHQSTVATGRWSWVAGVRLDYEHTAIRYANEAEIGYRLTLTMPDYKQLLVEMAGKQKKSFFEVMPKVAALYETGSAKLYLSVSRGYKAGGYNTQIFSDILQNRMMNGMMSDLGLHIDGMNPQYDAESAISYRPEYSWNYEAGGHFRLLNSRLFVDAALFYVDCRNQQLTVFPPGQTTGRMMSNAGKTKSLGAECAAKFHAGDFRASGSYGYTRATFLTYRDGDADYAGHVVPYAPQHTVSLGMGYDLEIDNRWFDKLSFDISWQGAGKIYWNESNTVSQPFYGLLNGSLFVHRGNHRLGIWAKNLTDTDYNTFYFKSVGNSFVQKGKPLQFGFFINMNIL